MSHIEIENEIDELEKELKNNLLPALNTVEQDRLAKQRIKLDLENKTLSLKLEISSLKVEIKDLDIGANKSRHLVKQQELLIKEKTREFWAAKKSGD